MTGDHLIVDALVVRGGVVRLVSRPEVTTDAKAEAHARRTSHLREEITSALHRLGHVLQVRLDVVSDVVGPVTLEVALPTQASDHVLVDVADNDGTAHPGLMASEVRQQHEVVLGSGRYLSPSGTPSWLADHGADVLAPISVQVPDLGPAVQARGHDELLRRPIGPPEGGEERAELGLGRSCGGHDGSVCAVARRCNDVVSCVVVKNVLPCSGWRQASPSP